MLRCRSVRLQLFGISLSLGPRPPISWVLVRFWRRKKCKTVPEAISLHVELFIRVTNDLVFYREGGNVVSWACQPCCSIDLAPQFVVIGWLQKNVDQILEFGNKMYLDSLQAGLPTYTRYGNAFHKQSPFCGMLNCREQQSDRLADITNKNTRSAHYGQK